MCHRVDFGECFTRVLDITLVLVGKSFLCGETVFHRPNDFTVVAFFRLLSVRDLEDCVSRSWTVQMEKCVLSWSILRWATERTVFWWGIKEIRKWDGKVHENRKRVWKEVENYNEIWNGKRNWKVVWRWLSWFWTSSSLGVFAGHRRIEEPLVVFVMTYRNVEMLQENQESGCTLLLFIRVDKPRDYDSLFLNEWGGKYKKKCRFCERPILEEVKYKYPQRSYPVLEKRTVRSGSGCLSYFTSWHHPSGWRQSRWNHTYHTDGWRSGVSDLTSSGRMVYGRMVTHPWGPHPSVQKTWVFVRQGMEVTYK